MAYKRLVELQEKKCYDAADKEVVSGLWNDVEVVKEKYKKELSDIKPFNIKHCLQNKEEAKLKIQSLKESHYFEYLRIAMQAEALSFFALVVLMKIAMYRRDEEDIKLYANGMNLDYWHNYVDQFDRIKHDVIKYLELEADDAWIHGKSITAMKEEQLKEFNEFEESMLKIQKLFEHKLTLYIKQEDGKLKKTISSSEP